MAVHLWKGGPKTTRCERREQWAGCSGKEVLEGMQTENQQVLLDPLDAEVRKLCPD